MRAIRENSKTLNELKNPPTTQAGAAAARLAAVVQAAYILEARTR